MGREVISKTPKYIVCPQCKGTGTMVRRDLSVWTQEDRAEDPEGFDFMINGGYDVACDMCQGARVMTRAEVRKQREELDRQHAERRESFAESGIYPGHPDYY